MVRHNGAVAVAPLIRSLGRDDFAAEFPGHDFEGAKVARALHDVHEGIHAELGKAIMRVQFAHERGVGLADGRRDGLGRHLAVDHGFVDGLDDL